ncbi:hypothetical protein [Rhizorhabdus histidinilytica]|uniref:hypothetical protein n=1 Tax=Rhizorhabdus histidinilytica TaxID=439228 RepID=UPI00321F7E9F
MSGYFVSSPLPRAIFQWRRGMTGHPTRYAILAATLSEAQRCLLRSLPDADYFDPDELPEAAGSLAALQRDGLIERAPAEMGRWLRLTVRGRFVRKAAEGMA